MKMKMQVSLTYRFEVFAVVITRFILILANVFLWKCVYADQNSMNGLNLEQMITYSVLSACLSSMFQCGVQDTMNKDIRKGDIALLMMKPYSLLGAYFAEDLGNIIVKTCNVSLPILIMSVIIFHVSAPVTITVIPLLFLSIFLGLMILWFMSALIGMLTFVTMELGNMGVLKDTIVAILSGSMIPLWFFPERIENILMMTPFPYTYQTPLGLYIGRISIQEGFGQIMIQIFWVCLLAAATGYTWKKVQKSVMVQGG